MAAWQVQEAKQRFSEVVRRAHIPPWWKAHGWTLVTRNVRDIQRTGVRTLDPFDAPG